MIKLSVGVGRIRQFTVGTGGISQIYRWTWAELVTFTAEVGGICQTFCICGRDCSNFFPGQLGMVKPSAGAGGIGPDCLQDCTKKKKKQQSSAHI